MQHKKVVAYAAAAIMVSAFGCSNEPQTPTSPTSATPGTNSAGPQGETLKATAPTPQSPVNNQQPDSLVLTAGKSSASFAGAQGPWSANASFRAPAGGYIRDNEVMDPLTNGRTAGNLFGAVEFVPGQGARLLGHDSHITYQLPTN